MKPVYICLQGPSVSILENSNYKKHRVVWASLNRFEYLEQNLGIKFDVVWCSSKERRSQIKDTSREIWDHSVSQYAYGFNSLWALLCALIVNGYRDVYLFGCDGCSKDDRGDVYYRQDLIQDDFDARRISIYKDTVIMNKYFWELMQYWGLHYRDLRIYNTNPNSYVKCFDFLVI